MQVSETAVISSTVHRKVMKLMGNRFELSVVGDNEREAFEKIDAAVAEISRIEKLLTTYKSGH
jgi:thiamine biosynthesis lipoprotein